MKFTDLLDEYLDACAEVQRLIDRSRTPEWRNALDRKQAASAELNQSASPSRMIEALQLGLDAMNTLDYKATPANRAFVVAAREALRAAGVEPRA